MNPRVRWFGTSVSVVLALALAVAASCTKRPATAVTVRVFADQQTLLEKTTLTLRVVSLSTRGGSADDAGVPRHDVDYPFSQTSNASLPVLEALIEPLEGNPLAVYRVDVVATNGATSDPRRVVARAISGYVPQRHLVLPLYLSGSCAGIRCDGDLTCVDGACVSATIPSSMLAPFTPMLVQTRDASVSESSVLDAMSPPESGVDGGSCFCSDIPSCDGSCTPNGFAEYLPPVIANQPRFRIEINPAGTRIAVANVFDQGQGTVQTIGIEPAGSSVVLSDIQMATAPRECPSFPQSIGWTRVSESEVLVASGRCADQSAGKVFLVNVETGAEAMVLQNVTNNAEYGDIFSTSGRSYAIGSRINEMTWGMRFTTAEQLIVDDVAMMPPLQIKVGTNVVAYSFRSQAGVNIRRLGDNAGSRRTMDTLSDLAVARSDSAIVESIATGTSGTINWRATVGSFDIIRTVRTEFDPVLVRVSADGRTVLAADSSANLYLLQLDGLSATSALRRVAIRQNLPVGSTVSDVALSDDGSIAAMLYVGRSTTPFRAALRVYRL